MNGSDLAGRTALVTGGARGIGRACCTRLASAGVKVAINYRSSDQQARETAALVESAGSRAHVVRADVSSQDEVREMVGQVTETLGPIDLLVNNAGVIDVLSHQDTSYDVWKRTLDINLTGTFLVTWAVKDGMVERGFGRIVNMTSIAGFRARPANIPYAVSKAGVISLTKSLAQAVADQNIRVNAVAPGLIETDMAARLGESTRRQLVDQTPMARLGKPEEVANLVFFLLSEQSSYMTGQTIAMTGGRTLMP